MLRLATSLQGAFDRRRWLAPALLGVLACALLLLRLGQPPRIMFDETYYVNDARSYISIGAESGFAVHPPLGKWLIALSITLFGDTPFGWRFVGAFAGVLTVAATYAIARRLLRGSPGQSLLAAVAPLLLLMDGLFLAQARIAMLDIFLVLFTTLGLWVLLVDHDRRVLGSTAPRGWWPSLRVIAGVCFGLAMAVKWSALLGIGVAGLLTIGWEITAARDEDMRRWWTQLPRRAVATIGSLLLVPAIVYAMTWLPWLANYQNTYTAGCTEDDTAECSYDTEDALLGLVDYHGAITRFHLNLEASHSYRSDPLGWVLLERPVVYWWETCSEDRANGVATEDEDTGEMVAPEPCIVAQGDAGEVLAVGNPALWWGFLLLLPALIAGAIRRDGRSALPLLAWLGHWLPWLAVSRTAFLFYLAPALPFLAIGAVVAIARVGERHHLRRPYALAMVTAGTGLIGVTALQLFGQTSDGWRIRLIALGAGWMLGAVGGALLDLREPRVQQNAIVPDPVGDPTGVLVPDTVIPTRVRVVDATGAVATVSEPVPHEIPHELADVSDALFVDADPADALFGGATVGGETPHDNLSFGPKLIDGRTSALLLVGVGLTTAVFLWLVPVWLAWPMTRGAVSMRWWLPGWI
jgi:dolichyl-phosphate-mannose-protein mannosyltransferase